MGYPTLRMHGDYLAIVTLDFGEITLEEKAPALLENPKIREAYLGE